jgi:Asp-tRNA(Asn)/Glu-tRNA(Gln) amidotransferase A subunit family amidase
MESHSLSPSDESNSPARGVANERVSRRQILKVITATGVGSMAFQRALSAQVTARGAITGEMIQQAEWIAGLELSEEERATTVSAVQSAIRRFEEMRKVEIGYDVPPALIFQPKPVVPESGLAVRRIARPIEWTPPQVPSDEEDLAFLPVTELAALLRARQISSVELTKIYLARLDRFDKFLHCVISMTDDLAMRQARRADREMAAGRYRGPLHGIPWGAKDLISYPGYKTTWGATPFQEQRLETKATVAARLDEAGAVLLAKLSLGALAWGDKWFGGMTRNPWNVKQGSSGSSAGSASATAAGLVGFALGSETLGSIVSPCKRCGCSGLRPTFGRVSRYGSDTTQPVVEVLKQLGAKLVPIKLPDDLPVGALTLILDTEAATVFDELTRNKITEGLNRWPPVFRQGEFVPAVEYLRANRIRTLLIRQMEKLMSKVDAYVGGNDLVYTNMTGHPTAVLPRGFRIRDNVKTPTSVTFTGKLFGETDLLTIAHAYQQATGHHLDRPDLAQLMDPAEKDK